MKHTFESYSSVWTLDDEMMVMQRLPKGEDPSHPLVSYNKVGAPAEFTYAHAVQQYDGLLDSNWNRLCVHLRNDPLGRNTPYSIKSGEININPLFSVGEQNPCPF